MFYYPDTNICIAFLRNKNEFLRDKFLSHPPEFIKISAIVAGELLHGVYKSRERDKNMIQVKNFLSLFEIVPLGFSAACKYGEIRAFLESIGKSIGPNDLLIAATVLSENGILVTNNTREFSRIKDLTIEDWII